MSAKAVCNAVADCSGNERQAGAMLLPATPLLPALARGISAQSQSQSGGRGGSRTAHSNAVATGARKLELNLPRQSDAVSEKLPLHLDIQPGAAEKR